LSTDRNQGEFIRAAMTHRTYVTRSTAQDALEMPLESGARAHRLSTSEVERGGLMGVTISVVIPTLGRSSLERAVGSVVRQSEPPDEIIIVANGPAALDELRKRSLEARAASIDLRCLSLPPFSGPAASRNFGAWNATSQFVGFLDDDDTLSPAYLAAIRARISEKDPDVIYGARVRRRGDEPDDDDTTSYIGRGRQKMRTFTSADAQSWLEMLYQQQNPGFGGQNLVVRRAAFFALGGFPIDLPCGEDRAFTMAALRQRRSIEYVDEALVNYRDPEGPRSSERDDKWVTNLKLIYQYWGDVSWQSRLRSLLVWLRSFRAAIVARRRSRSAR
jgi:GT2 family glycosyltransferase